VFEQFGVIKFTAWPKLDVLIKAITSRKYRYYLETDQQGLCTARVVAYDNTYTAVDGEPERALARAFYDCLKVTGSAQLGMFDGDDDDDELGDDDDDDPDAGAIDFPARFQKIANDHGNTITLRTDPGTDREQSVSVTPNQNGPRALRTVGGETFELDDLGRYVNVETGEVLDAFEVPRPMTAGR
jgi:hypothetical protein